MPLQFVNIKDSSVKFVNEANDPEVKYQVISAQLAMELAQANINLSAQEALTASLALELAQLKLQGGN